MDAAYKTIEGGEAKEEEIQKFNKKRDAKLNSKK
jgi:hypothetical protein